MAFNSSTGLYDGYIYCIENLINRKKYIGQTMVTVRNRYYQHLSASRAGVDTYLYRAMRLHGEENFRVSIVCTESDKSKRKLQEKLNELESFYIDELNTCNPNGYNMTTGGRSFSEPSSRAVALVSDNGDIIGMYQSIREAAECCGVNEKNIQHACQSKSHYSGDTFWYYADERMRVGMNIGTQHKGLNNWRGHTTYKGKRVKMMDLDGKWLADFESASEAARILNMSQTSISKCCLGERKSAGGYLWAFI